MIGNWWSQKVLQIQINHVFVWERCSLERHSETVLGFGLHLRQKSCLLSEQINGNWLIRCVKPVQLVPITIASAVRATHFFVSFFCTLCWMFKMLKVDHKISEEKVDTHSPKNPSVCPTVVLIHYTTRHMVYFSLLQNYFNNDSHCLLFLLSWNDSVLLFSMYSWKFRASE